MDTGKKKSMAAVICIFLIFVTFASLFYVAREENHNCTGKDCPICACVHQAKQVFGIWEQHLQWDFSPIR